MNQDGNNHDYQSDYGNRRYTPVPPKTWLAESILVTIFCCLPFGIVGIVKAASVESLFYTGRVEEAEMASRDAKRWTMIGFWIGLACVLIYGVAVAVLSVLGMAEGIVNAFTC